jgi:RHS repeat-associated protein
VRKYQYILSIVALVALAYTISLTTFNTEGKATEALNSEEITESSKTRYFGAAKLEEGNLEYQISDRLGSKIIETNTAGELDGKTNTKQKSYTGKKQTKTGTINLGAREYNTKTRRFNTPDPIIPEIDSSYAYSLNNPLKYIDPTGMVVEYVDDEEGRLEDRYNRVKKTLQQAADDGNEEAKLLLEGLLNIEESDKVLYIQPL